MIRIPLITAALVLGIAAPLSAHEFKIGEVSIRTPWARATIGTSKIGVVYLTIQNHGIKNDRLVAVTTPIAKRAGLHTHKMDGGVIKMRPVEMIEMPADEQITLKPGGLHIMLMGLKYPLRKGGKFPLTLTFSGVGSATISVDIQAAAARSGHTHNEK